MGLDELAGKRQAKAECGLTPDSGAMEAGEHLSLVLLWDSRSVIDDRYDGLLVVTASPEPHMPAVIGVSDGIAKNMFHRFPEAAGIADHIWTLEQIGALLD